MNAPRPSTRPVGGFLKLPRQEFLASGSGGDPFWTEKREFSRWEAWMDLRQCAAWAPHFVSVPHGELEADQ